MQRLTGSAYLQYQYMVFPRVSGRILQIPKRIEGRLSEGERTRVPSIDDAQCQQAVSESETSLTIDQAALTKSSNQLILTAPKKTNEKTAPVVISIPGLIPCENRINIAHDQPLHISELRADLVLPELQSLGRIDSERFNK
jgi:hypothetical protein